MYSRYVVLADIEYDVANPVCKELGNDRAGGRRTVAATPVVGMGEHVANGGNPVGPADQMGARDRNQSQVRIRALFASASGVHIA